ncbi:hypothetical protein [Mesorhizobium temperatum]|uniref:Uncharacterized protein n=1 Tax=Mesorhizobium temperatum TaxID=241416 RepID=A0A271LNM0_9HYPH|nr:hypothetical protein [Mesorhizobium temperatum]PAQ09713.1 hypothetical protein CIT26_11765 [Mesorhizobium temperatum]
MSPPRRMHPVGARRRHQQDRTDRNCIDQLRRAAAALSSARPNQSSQSRVGVLVVIAGWDGLMLGQLLMPIVVVADTGIVEQGPHDELVGRGGAYSLGAAPD